VLADRLRSAPVNLRQSGRITPLYCE
jgi:hypothetical protein